MGGVVGGGGCGVGQFMSVTDRDAVFAALADEYRRQLLERLKRTNGQTLSRLCEGLPITRQAVTKHLHVLEDAGLVRTTRSGRESIWEIEAERFEEACRFLDAGSRVKVVPALSARRIASA